MLSLPPSQSPPKWRFSHQHNSKSSPIHPQFRTLISPPTISCSQNAPDTPSSAGRIRRLVLSGEGRTKLDKFPDRDFYAYPRFVTHVDDSFISKLTNLYSEILRPEMEILDLMSSWVSHLPEQVAYKKVVGHGLNAQELARNPRLDYFFVKDLNKEQRLENADSSFDAVLCTVSVQYLQQPEKVFVSDIAFLFLANSILHSLHRVFAEVFRVLKPGGVFIVSFSNRMFYEKAIAAWRDGTGYSRVQLVVQYFQSVEGFTQPQVIRNLPGEKDDKSILGRVMGMFGLLSGSDPFYAVIAYKNFKPVYE